VPLSRRGVGPRFVEIDEGLAFLLETADDRLGGFGIFWLAA